jgi:hypothetical protein
VIKPEIIVSLGADDGSMTLYGVQLAQEWHFLLRYDKSKELNFISHEAENSFEDQNLFSKGFQHAIELMDEYEWHKLIPRSVHPKFAEQFLCEVEKRIPPNHIRLTYWKRLVARSLSLAGILN